MPTEEIHDSWFIFYSEPCIITKYISHNVYLFPKLTKYNTVSQIIFIYQNHLINISIILWKTIEENFPV